ncbi:MAG: alpha/beta fold hydrolase [Saprospiraceae bacterium]
MTLDDWHRAGKYFNYKGRNIFYRESGTGDTLLLIHGFPTASWDWHRIWEPLTRQFRVIAPDLIGFGFSAKPRAYHYSLMDQADLIEVMMEKMGVKTAHLLAHDYGDTVAQELLARWLERHGNHIDSLDIRSITLLNGGIFPGLHRPRFIQNLLASPLGPFLTPFLGRGQLGKTFREIFGKNTQPTGAEIDEFWSLIEFNGGKALLPRLIRYMRERHQFKARWVGAIESCPLPLCHINGAYDPISGRPIGLHFQQLAPQATVHFLANTGHYPQVEAPEKLLEHFFQFHKM